jgi:hypothetical protein
VTQELGEIIESLHSSSCGGTFGGVTRYANWRHRYWVLTAVEANKRPMSSGQNFVRFARSEDSTSDWSLLKSQIYENQKRGNKASSKNRYHSRSDFGLRSADIGTLDYSKRISGSLVGEFSLRLHHIMDCYRQTRDVRSDTTVRTDACFFLKARATESGGRADKLGLILKN